MNMMDAIDRCIEKLEEERAGKRKVNYKIRDAAFSRQRYWGEPFPIIWKNGIAYPLDKSELPLQLPHLETINPVLKAKVHWQIFPNGQNAIRDEYHARLCRSSWYFLRYMDPQNDQTFCEKKVSDLLGPGGFIHRWHRTCSRAFAVQPHVDKCLFDLGLITFDEPLKGC